MLLKQKLFGIFSAISLTSATFVVWTKNPIFSVLFLIFTFFNIGSILFLLNFEFLPIVFLVVYVGAIAVLFLFVLMMLNIKLAELNKTNSNSLPIGIVLFLITIYQLTYLLRFQFENIDFLNTSSVIFLTDYCNFFFKTHFFNLNCSLSNIKVIALAFYSKFLIHFLLAGMILLLAMVATIVLTVYKQFLSQNQNVYNQILKDFNHSLVHYK